MKPHKHAECIKAWADNKRIQVKHPLHTQWFELTDKNPSWDERFEYRIKPDEITPSRSYYIHVLIETNNADTAFRIRDVMDKAVHAHMMNANFTDAVIHIDEPTVTCIRDPKVNYESI